MAFIGTTTPLKSSKAFTASGYVGGASFFRGILFADKGGTLVISFSPDGKNWDISLASVTVTASVGKSFNEDVLGPYVRVVYTNSAADQGAFRLWSKSYA